MCDRARVARTSSIGLNRVEVNESKEIKQLKMQINSVEIINKDTHWIKITRILIRSLIRAGIWIVGIDGITRKIV